MSFDVAIAQAEIAALLDANPELAEDETLRADMVEGCTSAFDVLSRIARRMNTARTMSAATKAHAMEIRDRASKFERQEDAMRELAERIMRAADLRKAVLPEATLSIRAVPPSVEIMDETEIPEAFWKVMKSIDRAALKEALKSGDFVPGAALSNGGETLSVRVA
jgi:hypothetical protein